MGRGPGGGLNWCVVDDTTKVASASFCHKEVFCSRPIELGLGEYPPGITEPEAAPGGVAGEREARGWQKGD